MRWTFALLLGISSTAPACSKGENAGVEEAKKEAESEQKAKEAHGEPAKKIQPPVPGRAHVPCTQMINADLFTQGLGEKDPVTLAESRSEPDAAASCSVVRGGKRLSEAEQKAQIKKVGRLGVMPGDELCNVSAFCWTIEDPERFKKKCAETHDKDDDSLGFYACVRIIAQGADDVKRFQFFDDDTKCIIQVHGGPSNVDNDLIGKCAKLAHDLIGPEQIKAGGAPAAPPPAGGSAG
jgi:hypothetical protein